MSGRIKQVLVLSYVLSCLPLLGAEHSQLKAYPPAKEGMSRFVIVLPHKERGEDKNFMVELTVGKEMLTDGVNQVRLGGKIERKVIKGWGYSYYEVTGSLAAMSTLMATPEGAAKVKKFVAGAPLQINYNSRLPVVVYVPEGYEVRYRIWSAPEKMESAEQK
ncbi:MAG: ecotin family protein [Kiritimatiellae bacterium]|nr:ecotin family protein [Kiritimatiellia bacterium]